MNKLKKMRESKGLSQKEVSKMLDINIRQYQKYELGEQLPAVDRAIEIAEVLNTDVTKIWGRIAMENIKYKKIKNKFKKEGFVFSQNDSNNEYAAAQNLGGGWTDSNVPAYRFKTLEEAESFLRSYKKEMEWQREKDREYEERMEKRYYNDK